jgi:hypothetical protein
MATRMLTEAEIAELRRKAAEDNEFFKRVWADKRNNSGVSTRRPPKSN